MNAFLRIILCHLLLSAVASADRLRDEAQAVIDKTISDIHNNRLGVAWVAFSESSRRSYREALLNALEARQAAGLPVMPPSTASRAPVIQRASSDMR